MSTGYTQATRFLAVTSPLPADSLLLRGFQGQETMSRLFQFQLDLLSTNLALTAADLVGKQVTFLVRNEAGETVRFFHGLVRRLTAGPRAGRDLRAYTADIVPALWLLTLRSNCRIFQNMTAKDIIEAILGEHSSVNFQPKLNKTYRTREYCVQYRESDFDFISRLMEEEGIYYYFTHADGQHTLVLGDASSGYTDCGQAEVDYRAGSHVENYVTRWEHGWEFRPGKWTLRDYDFTKSTVDLTAEVTTVVQLPGVSAYERYDYPGAYVEKTDGEQLASARIEEEETPHETVRGEGGCAAFLPGARFKLADHNCDDEVGAQYVLTSVTHEASDDSYVAGSSGEQTYQNRFTCIPADTPFRPARLTPRPVVQGPQTAVVVGASGKEVDVDAHARVKVQFHWDREGQKNENSSCWIRVSQGLAGAGWGALFHPRIGQEVVVSFLEGNPDAPLVTGRVYNDQQVPPFPLPDEYTKSVIRTRSLENGTEENFNELRFDDKKDAEQIYFHAERDFDRVVENNDTLKVGFDKKDKGDQTVDIFNNQTLTVGADEAEDGSQSITVRKNRSVTVKEGDETIAIQQGNRTTTIAKNETLEVQDGNRDVTIGGNDTLTVDKNGNLTIKVSAGEALIDAAKSITLKVGQASIKIEPAKITLAAPQIAIQAQSALEMQGAQVKANGQATLELQGAMAKLAGSGMVQVQGGLVKIN